MVLMVVGQGVMGSDEFEKTKQYTRDLWRENDC
jgi:hypothetical protein